MLSDAGNHASMIEGIRHSRAERHIFAHNDPADLERKLRLLDPRAVGPPDHDARAWLWHPLDHGKAFVTAAPRHVPCMEDACVVPSRP